MSERDPSVKLLDDFAFGLARSAGLGHATVTIELERPSADRLLFAVSKAIAQMLMKSDGQTAIMLGQVFYYRGVHFRVVERVRP